MHKALTAVAVLVWSILALMLLVDSAAAERRVALVLGNAGYKNPGLDLVNAKFDAEDVAAALTGLGFEVLLRTDADKAGASDAIQQFARMAVGADAALFFYAGHALQYQGHNYLLPVDADVKDDISLSFETVPVDNVRAVLNRSSGVKIMVLDACRNNPVAERLARLATSASVAAPAPALGRTRGLERIDKAEGLIVAYATSPGDVALDGQERNSPFTKAFLRRLNEPGLEIEMMFRRIASDVAAATSGRQRPETYVSLVNEYYLNRNDRIAWDKIKTTEDPAVLHDFLEHFPSSFYALEARYRLQALERAIADAKERALIEAKKAALEASERQQAAEARRKAEEACQADRKALAGAGARDAAGLRSLARAALCDEVKRAAQERLTALEALLAEEEAICRRDGAALAAIEGRDPAKFRVLMQASSCPSVKAAAGEKIAAIEAEQAREADLCRREDGELKNLAGRARPADFEALRQRAQCPATIAAIDRGLRELAAAAEAACARDNAALGSIPARDGAALRDLVGRTPCESVKTAASARLAELNATLAREAEVCRLEDGELKGLVARRQPADIEAFRKRAQCPATIAAIDRSLRELAAAADAACGRDNATLNDIGPRDLDALRDLADRTSCPAIKVSADKRLAQMEASLAHETEICERDEAQWKGLAASGNRADVEALRQRAECKSVVAAIDRRLAELKTICKRDDAALAAIGARDVEGLRGLIGNAGCDDVKVNARQRLSKLETVIARETEACRRDEAEWKSLAASGNRADVEALRQKAECKSVVAAIDGRLAELKTICKRDDAALAAIGARDVEGLRGLIGKAGCDDVKVNARQRLSKLEAEIARETEACQRDEAEWKTLSASGDRAAMTALRQRVECPSVVAAIDRRAADLKAACGREQAALGAIGKRDAEAVRSLLATAACEEVKTAAGAKLAAIEADVAEQEVACRREDVELAALQTRGAEARDQMVELKKRLTCARLRPALDAALEKLPAPEEVNTPEQVRLAQTELNRLGCLSGHRNGKLDAKTEQAFGRYFEVQGHAIAEVKVDEALLLELKEQKPDLCAPPVTATPEPSAKPEKPAKRAIANRPPPEEQATPSEPEKPSPRRRKEKLANVPPPEEPRYRPVEPRPPKEKAVRPASVEPRMPRREAVQARQRPPAAQSSAGVPRVGGGGYGAGGGGGGGGSGSGALGVGF
ncbi:caspase family protein [Methylocapsa aurea]|uniref:caspase family protein n=1 Tax=Methylocapsa aurea TaxID=663610 RepID=UPI000690C059|nr:caspase family protein [Methylocapsa aurea]